MATVRKQIEAMTSPAMIQMEEWLRSGRARLDREASIKAIRVDPGVLQGRVETSMEHIRKIVAAVDLRISLDIPHGIPPVVAFEDDDMIRWLADGFHRVPAWEKLAVEHPDDPRWQSIPAFIVRGSLWDAVQYAVMANTNNTALQVTADDKRKMAEMMFARPEGWKMSDTGIGKQCGLGLSTVGKYRREYAIDRGIALPEEVFAVKKDGSVVRQPYGLRMAGRDPIVRTYRNNRGGKSLVVSFNGKRITADGLDSETRIAAKVSEAKAEAACRTRFPSTTELSRWLGRRGVDARMITRSEAECGGLRVGDTLIEWLTKSPTAADIRRAIGGFWFNRVETGITGPWIICCYPDELDPHGWRLRNIAESSPEHVRFMTPEEIVTEFGPKAGDDEGTPATDQ